MKIYNVNFQVTKIIFVLLITKTFATIYLRNYNTILKTVKSRMRFDGLNLYNVQLSDFFFEIASASGALP